MYANYHNGFTYHVSLNVREEEDGFITGDDDPVGDGTVAFASSEVNNIGITKNIEIDGNIAKVFARKIRK